MAKSHGKDNDMTIFAYIILLLSAISLISIFVEKKKYNAAWRSLLYAIVALIFIVLGCVWYLFNPGYVPFDFVLGVALGASVFFFIACFSAVLKKQMPILHPCFLISLSSTVFFALNFIL